MTKSKCFITPDPGQREPVDLVSVSSSTSGETFKNAAESRFLVSMAYYFDEVGQGERHRLLLG